MKFSKSKMVLVCTIVGIILIVSSISFLCFNNLQKHENKIENIIYYDVTFDYGNNKINKVEVENGNKLVEPEISAKEGMVFLGWYLDDELYDFNSIITNDITLVAKWQVLSENQISVTFDSNGGSFVQPLLLKVGGKILKPSNPKLDNHIFLGWYLNGKLFDFKQVVNENVVLVAKWSKIKENNNSNDNTDNNSDDSVQDNKILPQSIGLNLSNINLYCGDVEQIVATVLPAEASDKTVKWTSSNNKIVTVDGNGIVTPVSLGTAIITASTINRKTATVNVTVKEICKNEVSTVKPDKVTGVYIKYLQSNSVVVSYEESNNGHTYEIYGSSDNSNYMLLSSVPSLVSYLDNIDISKNYYYKVKSCTYDKKCGEFSDVVYVPAVKAPTNIQFLGTYSVKMNTGEMKVSFDLGDADSYYLYSSKIGVSSSDMVEHDTTNGNILKMYWDTNAVQYKVVAEKTGPNYKIYSSSDIYQIPSIGKAGNCNTVVTQTKTIDGNSINYTYQYDYNWELVSNIDGYILKETSNSRVFKSFASDINSYRTNAGFYELTLFTYKKGKNYNIETRNACSLSKNF